MKPARKFLIRFAMAPGDVSMLTALVRDLKLTYGPRYEIGVKTPFPDIWRHNPYLADFKEGDPGVEVLWLGKPGAMSRGIRASDREKRHFLTYFHREFEQKTGIRVPCHRPYPDIHLSEEEKRRSRIAGRYWIIVPGGKLDMTNKIWSQARYQEVVDRLRTYGLRFVQEGATKRLCVHPPLQGVLNLVGRTNIRDLIVNIYHAEGVICGITFQMHMAAAMRKPCVVIAGGRENPWWEAYVDDWGVFGPQAEKVDPPHRFLHTVGLLPCCEKTGCWKQRVVRLHDRTKHDKSLCYTPVTGEQGQIVPKCMDMITVDHVCEAVMSYYEDGTLEPIGKPKKTYPKREVSPAPSSPVIDLFGPTSEESPPPQPASWNGEEPVLLQPTELMKLGKDTAEKGLAHMLPAAMKPRLDDTPAGVPEPVLSADSDIAEVLAHPKIGGRVTICVLLYGEKYEQLHRRCLGSIVATVPAGLMDLRVAMNQVGDRTVQYVKSLPVTKTYPDYGDRKKYPAMREMFWDKVDPIRTKWIIWFDDDSHVREPKWLRALAETIIAQPEESRVAMLGQKMYHPLKPRPGYNQNPKAWFESAPWHHKKPWRTPRGTPAPNGYAIHFVTGGFWALRADVMRAADIPDPRLNHNGGDICIGEQVYQAGYNLKEFNSGKKFVKTSDAARRGTTELFPWYVKSNTSS